MKKTLLLGTISICLTFILLAVSSLTFPYKGFFPYKSEALKYTSSFLSKAANFDGVHYLRIAKEGYAQYEQAFFPLYPLLIKLFSPLFFGNYLYAALFLSNLTFILGLWFFYKTIEKVLGESVAWKAALFLTFFPTSFYFNLVYTESLFFFLFSLGCYFLLYKAKGKAFLSFFLLGLTRVIGIGVALFLFLERQNFLFLAPILGLFIYSFYLYLSTGDPLFFFNSQPAFGTNRSTKLILLPQVYFRYFKIFLTVPPSFTLFVAVLEVVFFTVVFLALLFYTREIVKKRLFFGFEVGLLAFSIFSLILPTFTGTFSSIPRYSLLAFSFFIFLAKKIKGKPKILTLVFLFLFVRIILTLLFAQGYYIS